MVKLLGPEQIGLDPASSEMLSDEGKREKALYEKGIPVFGSKEEASKSGIQGGFVWEGRDYGGYIPVNLEAGKIYVGLILESNYESIYGKKLPKFDEKNGSKLTLDQKINIAKDGLKTYQEYKKIFSKDTLPKFNNQTGMQFGNPREQIDYIKSLINARK
ncbi:MAG: hypothetical protein ACD_58C00120G0001 [uncultured bacterium]|nr:MAG: hypothetical protein ACD_58C00120G0001 [uncultured bacterium]